MRVMDFELVLWGIVPMGAAVVLALTSVYSLCHNFRVVQVLLSAPILVSLAGALWVLHGMLQGGWPTCLPHIAIVFALPVVVAQVLLSAPRKST